MFQLSNNLYYIMGWYLRSTGKKEMWFGEAITIPSFVGDGI